MGSRTGVINPPTVSGIVKSNRKKSKRVRIVIARNFLRRQERFEQWGERQLADPYSIHRAVFETFPLDMTIFDT